MTSIETRDHSLRYDDDPDRVIRVRVSRHGRDRLVEQIPRGVKQACNSHTGINHQVPIFSAHMPDIAAH